MGKYIIYIVLVGAGLFLGWLVSGNSDAVDGETSEGQQLEKMYGQEDIWTCSMHPQIMKSEPGDCPICGMALIPAETAADGLAANEIKMTENAMALANIETTIVGSENENREAGMITLSGKIAANEENNAVQSSYFDGRIERLNVNYEGQNVVSGQLLATIYAPSLIAAQQELITASSLKDSQPELYNAVRNKLKLWKLSEAQIANIEKEGKIVENFPVYATVSGTVSEVMAAEGDYLKQGQPIVKLSNLNSVWAEFDAYENQISNFKEGQNITITTNAYPNKKFEGTVSFIDPILTNATRTITVRATMDNPNGVFKPGMFVTGKIEPIAAEGDARISVPATAVMWTGERSLVYVKTNPSEPVFEMREVTLGPRMADNYVIESGIDIGDEIVSNGTFTVDAAAQLQGKKSMMNKAGTQMDDPKAMQEMKMSFTKVFGNAFQKVINPYLKMKDAFVASDVKKVAAFAEAASKVLKELDASALGKMESSHIKQSTKMLDAIASNDKIENQRDHFVILNENMVPIAMNVRGISQALFVQKCLMANNNKGAVWLSTEMDIRNPYYGDAMLTCGSVVEEIN